MILRAVLTLLAVLLGLSAGAATLPAPEARGFYALAYEELDAGRPEKAESFLREIDEITGDEGGVLFNDVLSLRLLALEKLGRFEDALNMLLGPAGERYSWREESREHFFRLLVDRLSQEGDFEGALSWLKKGRALLPTSLVLPALEKVVVYRKEFSGMVEGGQGGRFTTGGEMKVINASRRAPGQDWLKLCPPDEDAELELDAVCTDWSPKAHERLKEKKQAAWLHLTEDEAAAVYLAELKRHGLADIVEGAGEGRYGYHPYPDYDPQGWGSGSMIDGQGVSGGAAYFAVNAKRDSDYSEKLLKWMDARSEDLKLFKTPNQVVAIHKRTNRSHVVHVREWASYFKGDEEEFNRTWNEMTAELGRPPRPFVCFCGREMVLRESLSDDWGDYLTTWEAGEMAAVVYAYCPEHSLLVHDELLSNWRVTPDEVAARVRTQAMEVVWELEFERFKAKSGEDYYAVYGASASGLSRSPGLILGLLEELEGSGQGERKVKLWVSHRDALVVGPGNLPDAVGAQTAKQSVKKLGYAGPGSGPFRFRQMMKLPLKPEGQFRLTAAQ